VESHAPGRVFRPGVRVYRVTVPAARGHRALPQGRLVPLVGHCAVDHAAGSPVVVASDQKGWEGMLWSRLLDRLVKRGATIEEVTRRAEDAQVDGAAEAAAPLPR
jgi:hypothetical protein